LSENDVLQDLNCLRGIVEKNEECKMENKTLQTGTEYEDKNEKSEIESEEKMDIQNKQDIMEEEENYDKKSQKSFEEENDTDNANNNGNYGNKNTNMFGKKKQAHNSKNYSLRKINNNKQSMKIESEEAKGKDKIDSTRVLRNRKKNI